MKKLDDSLYNNSSFATKKEYGMYVINPSSENMVKLIEAINTLSEENAILAKYIYEQHKTK